MSDIKSIIFRDNKYKELSEYYGEKYQIEVFDKPRNNNFVLIDDDTKLFHKGSFITNSFNYGPFLNRIKNFEREHQLKKAISFKSIKPKRILDATAGLGHDAFIFALLGQSVTCIERNKGILILFEEALRMLPKETYYKNAKRRIEIINKDASEYTHNPQGHDLVYIDPMFQVSKKLRRNKSLTFINSYLGKEDDVTIDFIKKNTFRRIVVKRPKNFKDFAVKESFIVPGSSVDFKVLINS